MKITSIESVTKRYRKNYTKLTYKQKTELYSEIVRKIWIQDNRIRLDFAFPKADDDSDNGCGENPTKTPKTPQ